MNSNSLSVLIIGCGNIAGIFDSIRQESEYPLTHAGAFSRDGRFSITACVDPDQARRKDFMAAWHVPDGYSSIDDLCSSGKKFDVVSICSPTKHHAYDLESVIKLRPRLIFCEKPVTDSLSKTESLVNKCEKANIPLAVNYTRRWDPDIALLKSEVENSSRGQLRSISAIYNKGILNNGSHMLDLLSLIVGEMKIIKVGKPVFDQFSDDPTIPVWLEGNNAIPVSITCGHADDYALFEMQLVFSSGLLIMEEGGLFWRDRRAVDSTTFKGYRNLDAGIRRAGQYPLSMSNAVDNIHGAVVQGRPLASTGVSALSVQRLCEEIKHLSNSYL